MKLKAGQFYGKTSQTITVGGFRFTEKAYTSEVKIPFHAHELSHFCFVLAGNYKENIGKNPFEREPTALVYYPPDVSHSEEHFNNGRHFLVEIDHVGLEKVKEFGASLNEPVHLLGESPLHLAMRMYKEFNEWDEFSPLALESIVTELLIAASRKLSNSSIEKTPPKWLKNVKDFLHENYSSPPALSELADLAGVHPTHFARVFRQFESCATGEYIRKIRIRKARQAIISSNKSLVEIALETGFADQSHFTRSFKREMKMTPTEFRKIFHSC